MRLRNNKLTEDIAKIHLSHQPTSWKEKNRLFGHTWIRVCKECQHQWPCDTFMRNTDAMYHAINEIVDEIEYKQRRRQQAETDRDLLNAALGGIANIVNVYYRDDGSELRLADDDFSDYDMD